MKNNTKLLGFFVGLSLTQIHLNILSICNACKNINKTLRDLCLINICSSFGLTFPHLLRTSVHI